MEEKYYTYLKQAAKDKLRKMEIPELEETVVKATLKSKDIAKLKRQDEDIRKIKGQLAVAEEQYKKETTKQKELVDYVTLLLDDRIERNEFERDIFQIVSDEELEKESKKGESANV